METVKEYLPALDAHKCWTSMGVTKEKNKRNSEILSAREQKVYSHLYEKKQVRILTKANNAIEIKYKPLLSTRLHQEKFKTIQASATERISRKLDHLRSDSGEYKALESRIKDNLAKQEFISENRKKMRASHVKPSNTLVLKGKENQLSSQFDCISKHHESVLCRKRLIEVSRLKYIEEKLNRRQRLKEEAENDKRIKEAGFEAFKLLTTVKMIVNLKNRFREIKTEEIHKRLCICKAIRIQKFWKSCKATEYGQKYRNAVTKIRRFFAIARINLKYKIIQRYANSIYWVLAELETSNFQKVVRSYRLKVVRCQRLYRDYAVITKARLKLLKLFFVKTEREMIRLEQKKEFELRIEREILSVCDLFGKDEVKYQFEKLFPPNHVIKPRVGNNIDIYQISERLHYLRSIPVLKELLKPTSRYIEREKENAKLPNFMKPSRRVPKDLVFALLFKNIYQYLYQVNIFQVRVPKSKYLCLKNIQQQSGLNDTESSDIKPPSVPGQIASKLLRNYLSGRRQAFKQEYSVFKKQQAYLKNPKNINRRNLLKHLKSKALGGEKIIEFVFLRVYTSESDTPLVVFKNLVMSGREMMAANDTIHISEAEEQLETVK